MEQIDEYTVRALGALEQGPPGSQQVSLDPGRVVQLRRLYGAQVESRHLDFAARWLQSQGKGYYTIGSSGHESNAAVALLSRVTDPALLHYRSGGFYAARAAVAGRENRVRDILLSLTSAADDPMSGGRHKVFGHPELHIIPQTSTISSHLPRAVGLAFSLDIAARMGQATPWPEDTLVLCSFGDASANHSTAVGALNASAYLVRRGVRCPVLFVCEDNGIGISTRSPDGWPAAMLDKLDGLAYWHADGTDPIGLLELTEDALKTVRGTRRPAVLHIRTVRFMGHAGSDAEIAYRSRAQIAADYQRDPLVATARALVAAGAIAGADALEQYEETRSAVRREAALVLDEKRLDSRALVMAPLALPTAMPPEEPCPQVDRESLWGGRLPENGARMTLAQTINATLTDLMATHRTALVFGQDVAVKGGVYGVTRGLRKRFGGARVFDTLLDEQTILGTALGSSLAGFVPIPEIQYLAYLHNAEDQLRGEAASLRFFSAGQYQNGMVVRIAGLAYQRGFGGHFHNDNSLAVLRDIPGLVMAVPSHPEDAPGLLRTCFALARHDGRVCVFVEPIAMYHTRDLAARGDGLWTAPYVPPSTGTSQTPLGEVGVHGDGQDILLVSFGNGVRLSQRAAARLEAQGVRASVLDLRWLSPLPARSLLQHAERIGSVLVVDETRRSGGVSEGVLAVLTDGGFSGRMARVTSADSFIPLGPAAHTVLLGEEEVLEATHRLLRGGRAHRTRI